MEILDGLIVAVGLLVLVSLLLPKNRAVGVLLITTSGVGFMLLLLPDMRTALLSLQMPGMPSVELVPVLLVCVLVAGILLASALASKDHESGR